MLDILGYSHFNVKEKAMFRNYLRAAMLATLFASFSAHAGLITSLSNLEIDGTHYNVTFNVGQSFNDLFDNDGDGIFNDHDGSVFNTAPLFWGDEAGAKSAAEAIIAALGDTDLTNTSTDAFIIPHQINTTDISRYFGFGDEHTDPANDNLRSIAATVTGLHVNFPIATFQKVPEPPTIALIGLALGMMGLMGRRRRVC